jgi:hypothetical protein
MAFIAKVAINAETP